MNIFQAFLLGLIQGLTEFLPVSSSGHLEIGHALLGVEGHNNLLFTVVVHGATVLSTLVVFRKDIVALILGLFSFKWNNETRYISQLLVSAVPVAILGLFFMDKVETLFTGDLVFVGYMLLVTAILLAFTHFAKKNEKEIKFRDAIVIGIAQALAVLPGISRSGSTIATGLLLGKKKDDIARFSFLMVLLPVIMVNILDLFSSEIIDNISIDILPLTVGFITAFVSGLLACRWMISVVKRGKLIYFAIYCLVIGLIAIFAG